MTTCMNRLGLQNNRATSWRRHQVQEPPKPSMTASLWCLAALAVDQGARAEYYMTPMLARSHGCACTQSSLSRWPQQFEAAALLSHRIRVHEDAPGSTPVRHACSASACPPGLRGTRKGRYATLRYRRCAFNTLHKPTLNSTLFPAP